MSATITEDPLMLPSVEEDYATEPGWKVITFNNDHTPYDVAVTALQKACGISEEQANMIAYEVHTEGSAVVISGQTQEDAVIKAGRIIKYSRLGGLLEPMKAIAEKDD